MITVATWNVLHRVHADNWAEDVVGQWPDESKRIKAVADRVAELEEQVVALQEVSGDLLWALKVIPNRTVHAMRYPRTPSARRVPSPLYDSREYLVLLVNGPSEEIDWDPFPNDAGKGALAVEVQGHTIVATHVSWGDTKRPTQLALLREYEPAVLLGDFNADGATVLRDLGPGYELAELPWGATTRHDQTIDHVITNGVTATEARVLEADGLSDHRPVRATINW
ncbi:endonuclease/exonuclease/phosphatase family protein [Kutzneria buriramensis]|uniref:Endonuclease/exonuclease/phosphatase family metal-dependent hydrolase n=1 Tax=Kutzneria buriramensis TaxID=1045776 RepID=A0A3E0HEV6_9PSEU|nr:endonuclease/exonuclease/phosphatase family protein [Kutzneria buriramensis]REH43801.1 endonuclease/exonuclease/phosphatase family metal-dependent hydrolase [Kutzneria buriramensis]